MAFKTDKDEAPPPVLNVPSAGRYCGDAGRSWVYSKLKNDPTFPRPIKLSAGRVGFLRAELDEWIAARAAERGSAA